MKTLFERYLINEIGYLEVGHMNENSDLWWIEKGDSDVQYTKGGHGYYHSDVEEMSDPEFSGRVDHDKKIITMVKWGGVGDVPNERKNYIVSLLKMDYPGYKIYVWGNFPGQPRLVEEYEDDLEQPDMFVTTENGRFLSRHKVSAWIKKEESDIHNRYGVGGGPKNIVTVDSSKTITYTIKIPEWHIPLQGLELMLYKTTYFSFDHGRANDPDNERKCRMILELGQWGEAIYDSTPEDSYTTIPGRTITLENKEEEFKRIRSELGGLEYEFTDDFINEIMKQLEKWFYEEPMKG